MKSKLQRLAIVGIGAASASSFMASVIYGQVDKPKDIPALTYDFVEKQFDQDGKVVREMRSTHAIRSDGSSVEVHTDMLLPEPGGIPRELRMILDLSKPARITVHSPMKAVTTLPLDQRQADSERRQRQSCDGGATAIKSARMGYEVVSQRPIRDIPNLPSHFPDVEVWVAPALGCVRLEETMKREGRVVMIRQAENIRLGDPDPELFVVPDDYTEISPAQFLPRVPVRCQPDDADCFEREKHQRNMQLQIENKYWEAQQLNQRGGSKGGVPTAE